MSLPNCPKCESEYTYEDVNVFVCPECFHQWTKSDMERAKEASIIRDSNGNELKTGDDVIVIRDLKVQGASQPLKKGTKVKNITLIDPIDGHDINCKIDGFGNMNLKSEVVRKA